MPQARIRVFPQPSIHGPTATPEPPLVRLTAEFTGNEVDSTNPEAPGRQEPSNFVCRGFIGSQILSLSRYQPDLNVLSHFAIRQTWWDLSRLLHYVTVVYAYSASLIDLTRVK